MIPLDGQPILTAAAMRAAEAAACRAGATVESLMARAGAAVAESVRRLSAGNPVLILCGPGNNGGDGYVAAQVLREVGVTVRVAASAGPTTDAATAARAGWAGDVEAIANAEPAPILVDALFGTGLSRALDTALMADLRRLSEAARLTITVDLPSGLATDDGRALSEPPVFDLTLALGAAKPSHLLQPAARYCGTVRLLDIGVPVTSDARAIARPKLATPGPDAHKYSRGMVAVVAGAMAGASEMAAHAAMRAGAGYVTLLGETSGPPHALVRRAYDGDAVANSKIGALVIGPGLGRDADAKDRLAVALSSGRPLIVDGDALHLVTPDRLRALAVPVILTPHAGEFDTLFGKSDADKIARARDAARASGAVVVFKGADTVIAAPDGRVRVAGDASDWLSTAGTGDVLAGTIAAMLAAGLDPLDAAEAGVWLHGDAARRLPPAFIAGDLAEAIGQARASL